MAESSKSYFMYEDIIKVIFVDIDDNEYEFSITHSEPDTDTFRETVPCGNDLKNLSFEREFIEVTLTGPEQGDHRVLIKLRPDFHHDETIFDKNRLIDFLSITHYRFPEGGGSILTQSYVTSNRCGLTNPESIFKGFNEIENFEALGKNFGFVIESVVFTNNWKPIYYSKEKGIVAIHDYNNKLLVFDRFE